MEIEKNGVPLQRQNRKQQKEMLVYSAYNCLFNKMNDKLNWNNNQRQQQSSFMPTSPTER